MGPVNARAGIAKARDNLEIFKTALVATGTATLFKFIFFLLKLE